VEDAHKKEEKKLFECEALLFGSRRVKERQQRLQGLFILMVIHC
jgi:hypothetical protein